jgi:pimeloyl-ACP methyl ester carboxylesterase
MARQFVSNCLQRAGVFRKAGFQNGEMELATFLVAHGAWSAGWAWKKMRPLLAARGHILFTPSYTGLGERAHLAHPGLDLDAHIADILAVIDAEDLSGIILVGHSYGGMVATGVAAQVPQRIVRLVYVDAFVPRNGDSIFSLTPGRRDIMAPQAAQNGGFIPPSAMPDDTAEADRAWAMPRRKPQPLKTFEQPLTIEREPDMPRHYIYCGRHTPDDRFRPFYDRAQREGWDHHAIDASHNPHITRPEELADLLHAIATKP